MTDTQIDASTGVPLSQAALQAFKANFHGTLLRSGDADYDAVRQVWNGMIDRRPALIARCTGADDVIAAVNFAREQELLLSVRGGGHNVAGSAVCDGGLMIDLSLMRGVQVDAQARIARVQGGATWGDLDREAQLFGLATPGGVHSLTGIAGLTLGGGYGWLRRKYGLSCDNVLAVEIVTADGQQLRASPAEHPDLFWALRGGGGNFGVVTWFEFQLHPVGPMVYLCGPAYPLEQAGTVGRQWLEFMQAAPEEFTGNLTFMSFPDLPDFPPAARGRALVIPVVIAAGAPEAGEQSTRPLRQLGDPLLDLSQTLPYAVLQTFNDASFPAGTLQHYWKSVYVDDLNSEVIDAIALLAASRPSPLSVVSIWHFGGAMSSVEPTATAFWHRQVPFMVSFDAVWEDPPEAGKNIAWSRNACSELRKYSGGGAYVNFPGMGEDGEAQVRAAYGGNYDRLVEVKNKYDPTNLFRMNLNIKPTVRVSQGI
jgi:FAD/FMN-containing dehydrogenase